MPLRNRFHVLTPGDGGHVSVHHSEEGTVTPQEDVAPRYGAATPTQEPRQQCNTRSRKTNKNGSNSFLDQRSSSAK